MLVEDDARLAGLIVEYLSGYEFVVDWVDRGDLALARFGASCPDLVMLDLMLPGQDGMVLCRRLREQSQVPILILTAREDSYDEVSGLEQGADDFVHKPVQPRVLLARLRALLRRAEAAPHAMSNAMPTVPQEQLQFGQLSISKSNRQATWRGQPVAMSNTEFKLLLVLAEQAGQVLSRDTLLKQLRGFGFDGLDRSIDNHISRLRRHFDDEKAEKIKTVWGEGYLFAPSGWQ
jgi:two-component system OmpR family response regulator